MTVLTTLACTISATGISRPSYADIYETLQANFKAIYGTDAYIAPDSQDGQLLAIVARAQDDANAATEAAFYSYSPATAQGVALSNAVKINGIARAVATHSTVDLFCTGVAGTQINNGIVTDTAGNRWLLPNVVTIGGGGSVTATATAEEEGAISATVATVNIISTPTLGWQAVTNFAGALAGAPIETDAALRQRQRVSTALPSLTVLDGLLGSALALPGVTAARLYENDTNAPDANGLPAHSISLVLIGGVNADIAYTILVKKTPGCSTYGTTAVAGVYDSRGIGPYTINFYRPTSKRVIMTITGTPKLGYTSAVGVSIKAAMVAWVNALGIGKKVDWGKLFVPANLYGTVDTDKFEIDNIQVGLFGGGISQADVAIAFNEIAGLATGDITLVGL